MLFLGFALGSVHGRFFADLHVGRWVGESLGALTEVINIAAQRLGCPSVSCLEGCDVGSGDLVMRCIAL